jgi:hypothetical protein
MILFLNYMGQVCDVDHDIIAVDQQAQNPLSLKLAKPAVVEAEVVPIEVKSSAVSDER